MNSLIYGLILSVLPLSELRVGIPVAMSSSYPTILVFLLCVIANILIIPFIFLFFDYIHHKLIRVKAYNSIYTRLVTRSRKKIEHHIGTKWEMPALFLLVAIPIPGTGAYTGVLIAWLFKLKRAKAIISISLGVIAAGILVTLASLGVYSIL